MKGNRGKFKTNTSLTTPLALVLVCVISLPPTSVRADRSTGELIPSSDTAKDIDDACKDVIDGKNLQPKKGVDQDVYAQKITYCTAAYNADQAIDAVVLSRNAWGVVAGVCGTACFVPMNEWVCTGTNLAASGADIVLQMGVNEDFEYSMSTIYSMSKMASSLSGPAMGVVTLMKDDAPKKEVAKDVSKKAGKKAAQKGAEEESKGLDAAACASAAVASTLVVIKSMVISSMNDARQKNLNAAKKFVPKENKNAVVATKNSPYEDPFQKSAAAAKNTGTDVAAGAAPADTQEECGKTLVCAAAKDKSLPGLLRDPRLARDFKRASGMDLDDFMNTDKNTGGAKTLSGAFSGLVSPATAEEAFQDLEQHYESSAIYAGGGGGGSHGGGGGGDDLSGMMSGLMGQFMKKGDKDQGPQSPNEFRFGGPQGRAWALAEDSSVSLFDRISFRYRRNSHALMLAPRAHSQMSPGRQPANAAPGLKTKFNF
ncbi:MAG: hypothetical protein IT190_08415 [Microbacteriaceae bacterium]|nr:hypothetical protein [Microbacteriaceae bacterium]